MYCLPAARWYIAELIEEVSLTGFPRQLIHRTARFIYANSPEEVYEQITALDLDHNADVAAHKELVRTRFWSLAHLNIVREDLTTVADTAITPTTAMPQPVPATWLAAHDGVTNLLPD